MKERMEIADVTQVKLHSSVTCRLQYKSKILGAVRDVQWEMYNVSLRIGGNTLSLED